MADNLSSVPACEPLCPGARMPDTVAHRGPPCRNAATRRAPHRARYGLHAGIELVAGILPDTAARSAASLAMWRCLEWRGRAVRIYPSRPVAGSERTPLAAMVQARTTAFPQHRPPASLHDAVGAADPARMGQAWHLRHTRSAPLSARREHHVSRDALSGHESIIASQSDGAPACRGHRRPQSRAVRQYDARAAQRKRLADRSAGLPRPQFPPHALSASSTRRFTGFERQDLAGQGLASRSPRALSRDDVCRGVF